MMKNLFHKLGILAAVILMLVAVGCSCYADEEEPAIIIEGTAQSDSFPCDTATVLITVVGTDLDGEGDPESVEDTVTYDWYEETSPGNWTPCYYYGSACEFDWEDDPGVHNVKCIVDDVGDPVDDDPVTVYFTAVVHESPDAPILGESYSSPGSGCTSCSGSSELGVVADTANGKTKSTLVGDAAASFAPLSSECPPGASDPETPPGATGNNACIEGTLSSGAITADVYGNVSINGVSAPEYSWDGDTLTSPDGSSIEFNQAGAISSKTDSLGRTTTYTYGNTQGDTTNTSYDRISKVTDSFGNEWNYGLDINQPGPTYAINPDETTKVEYTYWKPGDAGYVGGEGQFKRATVKSWSTSQQAWVTESYTDYEFDSSDRVTSVTVTDNDDQNNPSETNVTYDGNGRVSEITNEKLQLDIVYTYPSDETIDSYTYGVTQVRRLATYGGSEDNTVDQVTKYLYYKDGSGNRTFVFRIVAMESDGSTGLQEYAHSEYQLYGYLTRFTQNPPADYQSAVLVGQPWKTIDAKSNTTTYEYSSENGLVTKVTLPTTDYTEYAYKQIDSADSVFVEKVRDTRGKYTQYTRDNTYPSLVTAVAVSDDDSAYTTIKSMSYYSTPTQKKGLLYQATVPDIEGTDDMVTTYDYDEVIDSTTYYRPSPTEVSYYRWNGSSYDLETSTTSYYSDGRTRWSEDTLGNRTDYTYNEELQITNTWLPADSADTGTVDSCTSTTITDSSMSWLDDQLIGMTLEITSGTYDGDRYPITDNTSTMITVSGTLPTVTNETYSVRPYSEYSYSACCGQVEWERDGRGKKTYYAYDSVGRLNKTWTDISGQSVDDPLVTYIYNDLGQETVVTTYSADSTGRTTTYTYDQQGRVEKIVYPYTSAAGDLLWNEYYQYDVNGSLVAKLVGMVDDGDITDGDVTAYEYDTLGRLTKVDYDYSTAYWPVSSITISTADVSYTYAAGTGLKTQMADGSGTSSYTYDTQGLLATYTSPMGLDTGYYIAYGYNNFSQNTYVEITNGTNVVYDVQRDYFKNGWLKEVTTDDGNVTLAAYTYDEMGNRTRIDYGNSAYVLYDYDDRYSIKSINHYNNTGEISISYPARDGIGNPLSMSGTTYGYDANNRLTSENASGFGYDWVGNRTSPNGLTYNAVDQLTRWPNEHRYHYDYQGNLTEVRDDQDATPPQRSYTYHPSGQLNGATYPDGSLSNTWDADGNRVELTINEDNYTFVYDVMAGIPAVIEEDDSETLIYYYREPGGALIARLAGENLHYYHFDELGSTRALTDGDGEVTDTYTYDAWGNATHASGTTEQPYQYVGELGYYTHYQDSSFGLLQLGFRFYDPETGRFTQLDPIGDGLNWYEYVGGNPIMGVDPEGLIYNRAKCKRLLDEINKRTHDLNDNHWSKFPCGFDKGHMKEAMQKWNKLQELITEYKAHCMNRGFKPGPLPVPVPKPYPKPEPRRSNPPRKSQPVIVPVPEPSPSWYQRVNWGKVAIGAGVVVGVAAIVVVTGGTGALVVAGTGAVAYAH